MAEQINKDRLDELLGIHEGQTFEDYIGEATSPVDETQSVIDQTTQLLEETKAKVDEIDEKFQTNMEVINSAQTQIQTSGGQDGNGSASVRIDNLINVENAFKSIEDLVDTTKTMISNVYGIISSCDVLDSETVAAAASLIGETRQLIAEYTSLYKQRIKFFDSVKMEQLKQEHRLEFLERKHQLDMEKWNNQHSTPAQAEEVQGVNGTVPNGMVESGAIDMLKLLQEMDDERDVEVVDEGGQT